jgi:hypothetical protein
MRLHKEFRRPLATKGRFNEAGTLGPARRWLTAAEETRRMNNIIYIIGLVVVVIAVLSFFGLR